MAFGKVAASAPRTAALSQPGGSPAPPKLLSPDEPGPTLGEPGGVTPCQPGFVTPLPGSVVTVRPSAEAVAVPSMTRRPVWWSNDRKNVFSPGASPNTFGSVRVAGVVNAAPSGTWMVMSKLCCSKPGGSMSLTMSGGTGLSPTWAPMIGRPSSPTMLPGWTVSVSALRCASDSRPPASTGTVITVGCVALTVCRMSVCTRGR